MIPVPDIAAVRVSSYDRFRPIEPYEADELLAEFGGILQTLIRMAQEYDLPYAQQSCRGHLLLLPNLCQFLGLHIVITGALVAVGAHHVNNVFPSFGPASYRSGNTVFRIVWMRRNHHHLS